VKRVLIALTAVAAVAAGYAGYAIADSSSDPAATCDPPSYDGTNLTLHCVVPQTSVTSTETATVTQTETATETITATETQTVPGPTTTVTETQTVTVTPTPTATPPPPPPGQWAPGEAINAGNTGYAGDGVTASQLTPTASMTYGTAYNGQTITLKAYTGEVDITGSHITIKDCSLTNGGDASIGFNISGSYNTVQNCTITSPAGKSMYEPVWIFGDHNSVIRDNVSRAENLITTYGNNVTIQENYLHDAAIDSNPSGHPDGIEVENGVNTLIVNNWIVEGCGPCLTGPGMYDSPVDIGGYASYKVQGVTVQGNFIDNGQSNVLIDNQNSKCSGANGDCLINVKIVGNAFGGHQCVASNPQCFHVFHCCLLYENRAFVQTDAQLAANPNSVEFPTAGAGANKWEESADIETPSTPHDGDVVIPSLS